MDRARLLSDWSIYARPSQDIPVGEWRIWGLVTGRGFGKNRTESAFAHRKALANPRGAGFLAGRTLGDVGKTIIGHPQSGILATQLPQNPCTFKPHTRRVEWENGAYADIHTSEEPDSARGPEYHWGIADEVGTWRRVVDFTGNTTWDNLQFGLRAGDLPQMVAGTTPRRTEIVRYLVTEGQRADSKVVLSRGSMLENRDNLAPSFVDYILERYAGTRLERQEVEGELLADVEGAILTLDLLAETRVDEPPDLAKVVVGVDPAGTTHATSDLTGINVAGRGVDGDLYAIADYSCKLSPQGWARRVIEAYEKHRADYVVAETNYGGDMVVATLRSVDPRVPVKVVSASRAKHVRFGPIGAFYERREAHIVGSQPELEDELCGFTLDGYDGDASPNRADAHVWAATELMLGSRVSWADVAEANA